MIGGVGVHRTDDAEVVDVLGGFREDLTDLDAAFAVLLEPERRGQAARGFPLRRQVSLGQHLAFVLLQERLGIEGVDLRRTTVQVDVNDVLGFRREMGRMGCQGVPDRRARGPSRGLSQQSSVAQQAHQAEHAHPRAGLAEGLAASQRGSVERIHSHHLGVSLQTLIHSS